MDGGRRAFSKGEVRDSDFDGSLPGCGQPGGVRYYKMAPWPNSWLPPEGSKLRFSNLGKAGPRTQLKIVLANVRPYHHEGKKEVPRETSKVPRVSSVTPSRWRPAFRRPLYLRLYRAESLLPSFPHSTPLLDSPPGVMGSVWVSIHSGGLLPANSVR